MKRTALITGISGMDGSNLAEFLLAKGYRVAGILRRHSVAENQDSRISHLEGQIETYYGDLLGPTSLLDVMQRVEPDEIYNLAAQSHVKVSWDLPEFTADVNGLGVLRMLETIRHVCPHAKFYQASSSELFGGCVDNDGKQRETTRMVPTSPYGCAKLFGFAITGHYRRAFGMFACNGILFNHTGPRRGATFVEAKVVRTAVQIKHGLAKELILGNMDSQRDWGASRDYVRAMWLMLQQEKPDDYVVATGQTHSIRELCEYVFGRLGLDYRDYVRQDSKFMRPEELPYLCGDSSKARQLLGWEPEQTFESVIYEMIETVERRIVDGTNRIAG
jgi:GDPmannose 4,6-dehydratase